MKRFDLGLRFLVALALLFGASGALAARSYDNCAGFITSLPAVIGSPGTWCLKQDLGTSMSSGVAIDIQADDVSLDCSDFKIVGTVTQSVGIYAGDRANTTVRNCDVRGFFVGVAIAGSAKGHVIENNRFEGNTFIAIDVNAPETLVRQNRVYNTGGSTQFNTCGIRVLNFAVDILDNTMSGVRALAGTDTSAYGIYALVSYGSRINGNRVRGVVKAGAAEAYGNASDNGSVTMRDNDLIGDGSASSVGVYCVYANPASFVKDNVISGFATANFECSDGGGNTIIP